MTFTLKIISFNSFLFCWRFITVLNKSHQERRCSCDAVNIGFMSEVQPLKIINYYNFIALRNLVRFYQVCFPGFCFFFFLMIHLEFVSVQFNSVQFINIDFIFKIHYNCTLKLKFKSRLSLYKYDKNKSNGINSYQDIQ